MFPCVSPPACLLIPRNLLCVAKPTKYQLSFLAGVSRFSARWLPPVRNRFQGSSSRVKAGVR